MLGTYHRLNVHVWSSDLTVIRAARRKLVKGVRRDRTKRTQRHAYYRAMLDYHRKAQRLCIEFRM